jgi:hypothetical protein
MATEMSLTAPGRSQIVAMMPTGNDHYVKAYALCAAT